MTKSTTLLLAALCTFGLSDSAFAQRSEQNQGQRSRQEVRRTDQQGRDRGEMSRSRAQQRTVTGKVISLRTANIKGQQDKHVLAKIRTSKGQTVIADFGSQKSFEKRKANLKGKQVTVAGRRATINDRPVLLVERLRMASGKTTKPQQKQQQPQRRQQAGSAS